LEEPASASFTNRTFGNEGEESFSAGNENDRFPPPPQPPRLGMALSDWLQHGPVVCADETTMGYDSWSSLQWALRDANVFSAHRHERWAAYFASVEQWQIATTQRRATTHTHFSAHREFAVLPTFDDDSMYYEEQLKFTICPKTVLRANSYPLFIDTESVVLECSGCVITGGVSHISFGPEAKNTIIRGITFQRSSQTSLLFHHHGAEATFEDCTWIVKDGGRGRRQVASGLGSIAHVNSTSVVNFYRCTGNRPRIARFPSIFSLWQQRNS
jgi:hypothetical protein